MALEGTIKDFGLPDIFQLIGLQRKTGILTLKREKEHVTVTFEQGMVVNAENEPKRTEDRLGIVLVKQGKLSDQKLEEALQKQKATLQRLGHVLVAHGYVTAKELKDALQVQVSQIVFKLFRWKDGDYHFEPTEKAEYDRENFNPMSADFILMEGIRMLDEWPIIEKKIPSMDIVFRAVVDASLIEVEGGEEDDVLSGVGDSKKGGAATKIRLTPEEHRVYRKVDGARTVQAIIDATGMGDFDVCRTLFDLLNRNIVATAGKGGAAKSQEARQRAASPVLGYALLGAVMALSVAGLALQHATPFGVLGRPPLLNDSFNLLMDGVSRSRIDRLDRALQAFRLLHGSVPKTLEELAEEGLVDGRYLKDPWSRPYRYAPTPDGGYRLSAVDEGGKAVASTVVERALTPAQP